MESLVFPRFDYACAVYYYLDKTRFDKIQVMLKACVRFVVGRLPFLAHVTPHLLGLHWLSAHRRREYFIGTLTYAVVANDSPAYLTERFHRRQHVDLTVRHSVGRPPQAFVLPGSRTEAHKRSFTLEAMSLLNSVHVIDFAPRALQAFKQHLFETLFARDIADWMMRVRDERLPRCLLNIPRARL